MLELIFEFLVSFIVEFFGQMIIEILAELGLRSILSATGLGKHRHPLLSVIGYSVLGAIAAGLSLIIYREHFLREPIFRLVNLIVSPILAGTAMGLRGKILKRKGRLVIKLDTFGYGYLFALTFALVRYVYAT